MKNNLEHKCCHRITNKELADAKMKHRPRCPGRKGSSTNQVQVSNAGQRSHRALEAKETVYRARLGPVYLCVLYTFLDYVSFFSMCSHEAAEGPSVWKVVKFDGVAGGKAARAVLGLVVKCLKC